MPGKQYYKNEGDLIKEVKADLEKGLAKTGGRKPQILIIGALGRCGGGALDLCRAVGIPESNLLKWDLAETAKVGISPTHHTFVHVNGEARGISRTPLKA